jgi:serine/threonine-protein kinase
VQPALVPDTLGEFAIEHELGRGGSGVVYAARQAGRVVALKVLRNEDAATPKERQRFLSEARNLAKVQHPGVVRVVDVGELPDGRPYLAMERLHGATLADKVMMTGRMPVEQALVLFEQLVAAVAALHAVGLVHRDIKPENIMIEGERLVLLDLGIARELSDLPSTTTQAGLQRGTPAYMAPERFFGARATVSSDVYETAVVLYVMVTGALPWDPTSPKDRMTPRAPTGVSEELGKALMTALGFEPVHRPKTIEELARLIRGAAWDGDTKAAPAAVTQKTKGKGVIAGVGVIAAFAAAIGIAVVATRHKGRAEPEAAAEPVAVAEAVAGPGPVVVAIGIDAGVVSDAAPVVEEEPEKRTKTKTKSKSKSKSKVQTQTQTKTGTGTCQKIVDLYCTDEFKATEGGMAGVLCTNMTKQLPSLDEAWCQSSYDTMAGAVKERLRMFKEGFGPPTR